MLRNTDFELAAILNAQFALVFTEEVDGAIPERVLVHEGATIEGIQCTIYEVLHKLENLCINKSPGPDGFLPKLLQEVREEVSSHFVEIFNRSLQTGEVPRDWREPNVTPVFKKGDRTNPGNYRPISLTSIVGKILEGIVVDSIVEFLEGKKLAVRISAWFQASPIMLD